MASIFDTLPTPKKVKTSGGFSTGGLGKFAGYGIMSKKVTDYEKLNKLRREAINTAAGGLKTSVADILGLQDTATEQLGLAEAQGIEAEGAGREAEINRQSAALEKASGDIQLYQNRRDLALSMGTTYSQLAGRGLSTSGSGMDLLSSSMRQGTLQQQLTMTQTAIDQGGYLTAAAAADTRVATAQNLQSSYLEASGRSTAEADAEAKSLLGFMKDVPGLGGTREGEYAINTLRTAGYDKFKNVSKTPYMDEGLTFKDRARATVTDKSLIRDF